jgi:Spy/CpxP family protein refolding chaperone
MRRVTLAVVGAAALGGATIALAQQSGHAPRSGGTDGSTMMQSMPVMQGPGASSTAV